MQYVINSWKIYFNGMLVSSESPYFHFNSNPMEVRIISDVALQFLASNVKKPMRKNIFALFIYTPTYFICASTKYQRPMSKAESKEISQLILISFAHQISNFIVFCVILERNNFCNFLNTCFSN